MRKTIAIIAATVATFSLNAASCEQLAPTPAIDQIVTFDEVDPPGGGTVPPPESSVQADPQPCWPGAGYERTPGQNECPPPPPSPNTVPACVSLPAGAPGCPES